MHDQRTLQALRSPAPAGPGIPVVVRWPGRETRALRLALRLTNEKFAAHLRAAAQTGPGLAHPPGVVMVPQRPRALDSVLDRAADPARERFALAPHRH